MGLAQALAATEQVYGETVAVEDFVTWSEWALARVGFRPSNALPVLAVCRDELMGDVDDAISATWGRPFQVGSLAGMVFVGRTGMSAALGHVPGEDGRHRFVVFCLPHIGMDDDGDIGHVQRRGMYRESSACGALVSFQRQLAGGEHTFELEALDVEQSLLRRRLAPLVSSDATLVELTEKVRQAAVADVCGFIDLARGAEPVDVAYISGVVVHLPDGADHVVGVHAEVWIDDQVIPLPH